MHFRDAPNTKCNGLTASRSSHRRLVRSKIEAKHATMLEKEGPSHNPVEALAHGNGADASCRFCNCDKARTGEKPSDWGRCKSNSNPQAQLDNILQSVAANEKIAKMLECLPGRTSFCQAAGTTESCGDLRGRLGYRTGGKKKATHSGRTSSVGGWSPRRASSVATLSGASGWDSRACMARPSAPTRASRTAQR